MIKEKNVEEELIELLEDAQEKRRKAEQRLKVAQNAIGAADREIATCQHALELYRAKYGLKKEPILPESAVNFVGRHAKQLIESWDKTHGGTVVMDELCEAVVTAGLFPSKAKASGTLYPTIRRWEEYKWISRGIYQRVTTKVGEVQSDNHKTEQPQLVQVR